MKRALLLILIMLLTLTSCGSKKTAESLNGVKTESEAQQNTVSVDTASFDKKIITNSEVNMNVKDIKAASKEITLKAESLGGYIQSENQMENYTNIIARVPSQKLNIFLEFLEQNFEVLNKNISKEDITSSYIDNEARLKNLKAQEEQILEILKMAKTVDEVLKVQGELFRIRGEIESLEAQKKNWDRQIDYSLVNISAHRKVAIEKQTLIQVISGSDLAKKIKHGFANSILAILLILEYLAIFVLSNIIYLALLAILAFWAYKRYKHK